VRAFRRCAPARRSPQEVHGRPQNDRVRLWGAIDENRRDRWCFRVLPAVADAADGKPRGTAEIRTALRATGIDDPLCTIVSDEWKATLVAVLLWREEEGWPTGTLRRVNNCNTCATEFHAVLKHKEEFISRLGDNTNTIERRWGVLKAWLKSRSGGRLPQLATMSREEISALVGEFTFFHSTCGLPSSLPPDALVRVARALAAL